jgi:hypothetical protein
MIEVIRPAIPSAGSTPLAIRRLRLQLCGASKDDRFFARRRGTD